MYCKKCDYYHKSNSITTSPTSAIISFTDAPLNVKNTDKFCFVVCQDIPSVTQCGGNPAVTLLINAVSTVALLDRYGNPITLDKLKSRTLYRGYYGTGGSVHVIAYNQPPVSHC